MNILLLTDEYMDDNDTQVKDMLNVAIEDAKYLNPKLVCNISYDHPGRSLYQQINADLVIVDYGGLGLGCSGFIDELTNRFVDAIFSYPSTQFILISGLISLDANSEISRYMRDNNISEKPHNFAEGWDAIAEFLGSAKQCFRRDAAPLLEEVMGK